VKYLLMAVLKLYQWLVSPLFGPTCRFYPSCSRYAYEAISVHGAVKGCYLAARRLLRCHPWNPGGLDPVPPRRKSSGAGDAPRTSTSAQGA
jgi:putative membrane protein insertion efficiency factor